MMTDREEMIVRVFLKTIKQVADTQLAMEKLFDSGWIDLGVQYDDLLNEILDILGVFPEGRNYYSRDSLNSELTAYLFFNRSSVDNIIKHINEYIEMSA